MVVDVFRQRHYNEGVIHCYICDQTLEKSHFYKDRRHVSGFRRVCKDCERLQYRERRIAAPEVFRRRDAKYYVKHRAKIAAKRRKYYAKFGQRQRARARAAYALLVGTISRKLCEVCKSKKADAHHDDYSKPLVVRWLCRRHHMRHHAETNNL